MIKMRNQIFSISYLINVFLVILFLTPIGVQAQNDIPMERALKHLSPKEMDQELDNIISLIQQICDRDFSKIKTELKPLYKDSCLLPKLIPQFRKMLDQLSDEEVSGVQTVDLSKNPMLERFKYLKSLTWQRASFSNEDGVSYVSKIILYQLAIFKSFKSFSVLSDIWNGKQKNSNFHLYVYPKITAYLESSTLFGVILSYYNNIQCSLEDYAKPIIHQKCYRYKAQIAAELVSPVEKNLPSLIKFKTGIEKTDGANNKDIVRLQKINALYEFFYQAKQNPQLYAYQIIDPAHLRPVEQPYTQVYNLLNSAVNRKITLGDSELMEFYLAVSSVLEVRSATDSIWSLRAYQHSENAPTAKLNLGEQIINEFETAISTALHYLEAQDGDL